MLCPSCNRPYIRISHLINPPRLIYVHREVGRRDVKTKERKPVEWCMSRTGRGKGAHIEIGLDNTAHEDVMYGVDGEITNMPSPKTESNQTKTPLLEGEGLGDKKMPFVAFSKAKLDQEFPSQFGRGTGKPSISVGANGRMQFSVTVAEALTGCSFIQAAFDADTNRVQLRGSKEAPKGKEADFWEITRAKDTSKNKTCSISASRILKKVDYDYAKAGNQTYEVEKQDNEKHVIIFALPKTTPEPKPKVERKPRAAKAAVNGAVPPAPVAASAPASAASRASMGQKPPADEDELIVDTE